MIASLIILAAIGISGSCFIIGTLLRDDAAEDVSDRIAHGDVVWLPPALTSFHDRRHIP
jgi:hypothetical protein